MFTLTPSDNRRLWSKVQILGKDDCWPWLAGCSRKGYAQFWLRRTVRASRVIYQIITGDEVPADILVCHSCDNPPCCNPAHLFLGTPKINQEDCSAKFRKNNGEENVNAKLTAAAVQFIRNSTKAAPWLAVQFSVSRQTIHFVRKRMTWRHL